MTVAAVKKKIRHVREKAFARFGGFNIALLNSTLGLRFVNTSSFRS
jgi:hypothetical protein